MIPYAVLRIVDIILNSILFCFNHFHCQLARGVQWPIPKQIHRVSLHIEALLIIRVDLGKDSKCFQWICHILQKRIKKLLVLCRYAMHIVWKYLAIQNKNNSLNVMLRERCKVGSNFSRIHQQILCQNLWRTNPPCKVKKSFLGRSRDHSLVQSPESACQSSRALPV